MPIKYMDDETYHSSEGWSKTGLHTAFTKTPFHARYVTKKKSNALEMGKAAHIAILQPELLDASVTKGPAARGNSNAWKEAEDFARKAGTILLKPEDFDTVMEIRELAAINPDISAMQQGEVYVETAATHVDEETGLLLKTKPDIYNATNHLIADVKNMADASWTAFKRDVGKFGYHFQDAMYSDVWSKGSGLQVDGFFFIVFEKSNPPLVACYELLPSAVREGFEQYRAAVELVAKCEREGEWPGYPSTMQQIGLNYRDYKLTPPPTEPEVMPQEDDLEEGDEEEIPE